MDKAIKTFITVLFLLGLYSSVLAQKGDMGMHQSMSMGAGGCPNCILDEDGLPIIDEDGIPIMGIP